MLYKDLANCAPFFYHVYTYLRKLRKRENRRQPCGARQVWSTTGPHPRSLSFLFSFHANPWLLLMTNFFMETWVPKGRCLDLLLSFKFLAQASDSPYIQFHQGHSVHSYRDQETRAKPAAASATPKVTPLDMGRAGV